MASILGGAINIKSDQNSVSAKLKIQPFIKKLSKHKKIDRQLTNHSYILITDNIFDQYLALNAKWIKSAEWIKAP